MARRLEVREPRTWLALATLFLVIGLVLSEMAGRSSPGPLSGSHARVASLQGPAGCKVCHGAFLQAMAPACLDCHEDIEQDLAQAGGLHGTLAPEEARSCNACHLEHNGEDFVPITEMSFHRAGVSEPETFDHALLGRRLLGKHTTLACTECHAAAEEPFLEEGTKRFLGLSFGCEVCHEDVHEGNMALDCAACHLQVHPFAEVHGFDHARFDDGGPHAEPRCTECHVPEGEFELERVAGPTPPPDERACAMCHESPHAAEFLEGVASLPAGQGAGCAACHAVSHTHFFGRGDRMPVALHEAASFSLASPHDGLACVKCHAAADSTPALPFAERFPGRSPETCESCHGDPHAGSFTNERGRTPACLECHARDAFQPSGFDVDDHEHSRFPLTGEHLAVGCQECHPAEQGPDTRFRLEERACAVCHEDAHRGLLQGFTERQSQACETCHTTHGFDRHLAAFEHDRHTAFALRGAHREADCAACHVAQAVPDELGRSFGFARPAFGPLADGCTACHEDPHAGLFQEVLPGLPRPSEQRCERCHEDGSFHVAGFRGQEHRAWTGYDTGGVHAGLSCEACHVPLPAPDALGRTFERAAGTTCFSCHDDPHAGQFFQGGATDCARCHDPVGVLDFDHQRDTRFPLDEQHLQVSCASCHVPWPLPDGRTPVRYKPLGTECVDCHAVPAGTEEGERDGDD